MIATAQGKVGQYSEAMSTTRNPVPTIRLTNGEAGEVLKQHMDETNAVELVERLGRLDTTQKAPWLRKSKPGIGGGVYR